MSNQQWNALEVRVGTEERRTLRLRVPGASGTVYVTQDGRYAPVTLTVASGWKLVAVYTKGQEGKARCTVLEPAETENELRHGALYVRGRFRVVLKVHHSELAAAAFKAFEAE